MPAKHKMLENRAKTSACRPSRSFSNLFRVSVMFAVYKCLQHFCSFISSNRVQEVYNLINFLSNSFGSYTAEKSVGPN